MQKTFYIFFLLIANFINSQNLSSPESVEWDEFNNRWLIGNTGNGTIISRSIDNVNSAFISGIPSGPYGVEIVSDIVYCCAGGFIRGYNLTTGTNVFNVNLSATFLNGLTSDGNNFLYATDFSAKKIFKIDITNSSFTTIASNMSKTPNGIYFDGENNRCVFVTWGTNAPIMAIDLTSFTITTVLNTSLGNCDGITRDSCGNYYVTAWSNNKLNKFNPSLTGTFTVIPSTLTNPADIDFRFDDTEDVVGIPNSGNVTLIAIPNPVATITIENDVLICGTNFDGYQWYYDGILILGAINQSYTPIQNGIYYCIVQSGECEVFSNEIALNSLGLNSNNETLAIALYPNPSTDFLNLKHELIEIQSYIISNTLGQMVLKGVYQNQPISISNLGNGMYFIQLKTNEVSKIISFVKSN